MPHTRINIACDELKELYINKKLSLFEIGKLLGYSARTIQIRAIECKINLRSPGPPGPTISNKKLEYLYTKRRLSSRKIAKIYNCAYSTIDSKIKKLGLSIRTLSNSHIVTKRKNFNGSNEEKAYLVGFKIGDLRARRMYKNSETILVDCGSTKPNQIKLIKRLFKKYGRVWVSKPKTNNKVQIECSLNNSFTFLLKKYKKFPSWILTKNIYELSAIAGFIDAEGSFFISKNDQSFFSVGNYKKAILDQINNYLIKRNYKTRLCLGVKKGYTGKDGYPHSSDYWILTITRKEDLKSFAELMLPYLKHQDRINQAKNVLRNIKKRNLKYGFLGMKHDKMHK